MGIRGSNIDLDLVIFSVFNSQVIAGLLNVGYTIQLNLSDVNNY